MRSSSRVMPVCLWWLVGMAASGCAGSSAKESPGDTVGSLGNGDAVADAGQSADGTTDAAVDPRYRAFFMVERWQRADPTANHTMAAIVSFHTDAQLPRFENIDGFCGYHEGDWVHAGMTPPAFGTVRMEVPLLGEVTWVSDPQGAGYEPPSGMLGWDTGDNVKLTTSGGDVPGFVLEDTVPAKPLLTSHDLPKYKAGQLVIKRDQPLALTWEPVATEVFALFLQFDDATYKRKGILCFFPGASGSATIPTQVLAHLILTKEVKATNFYFSGASRKKLALDKADVEMVTWKGEAARVTVE